MPNVTVSATDSLLEQDFIVGGNPGTFQTPGIYPLKLAATKDLLNFSNNFPSYVVPVLQNAILATDQSILLSSGTGVQFPSDTFEVSVDNEIIFVYKRSGDTLTNCIRGAENTTPSFHTANSTVQLLITALAHNQVVAEIVSIENFLGAGGANIASVPIEISFTAPNQGDFQVAHGLGKTPTVVFIQVTSDGLVRFQNTRYDNTYVYLSASTNALTGYIQVYR